MNTTRFPTAAVELVLATEDVTVLLETEFDDVDRVVLVDVETEVLSVLGAVAVFRT